MAEVKLLHGRLTDAKVAAVVSWGQDRDDGCCDWSCVKASHYLFHHRSPSFIVLDELPIPRDDTDENGIRRTVGAAEIEKANPLKACGCPLSLHTGSVLPDQISRGERT